MSGNSVIPWLFLREMTPILTIVSSSEKTMTKKTTISDKEMMTIVTIVSSSKTMIVIRTMIINKEILTSVTFVNSNEIKLTT